ncbi:MAG TPA: uroporphyrinogen-III synthase [Casimicrobiaceae bacterium]|nr:uroporphyrinogen-III synthase [Casimicrobiaceae bacterium]
MHALDAKAAQRGPLQGLGIVVTRPARQSTALVQRLASLGATPIAFPAIVILPPSDRSALDRAHANLDRYDFAVFVSANAVEYGAPDPARWPAHLLALAPGPGTADALIGCGIVNVVTPTTRFDSEGLLELTALANVAGKRAIIFKGEYGRDLIAAALRKRGASVDDVICYRRARPQASADGLLESMREGRVHAVTITSSEGLDNLAHVVGDEGRMLLTRIPLFVPHPRIVAYAKSLGFTPIETAGADAGLLAGLLEWSRTLRPSILDPKPDH